MILVTKRQIINAGADCTDAWFFRLTKHSDKVVDGNLCNVYDVDVAIADIKGYLTRIDHLKKVNKDRTEYVCATVLKALATLKGMA